MPVEPVWERLRWIAVGVALAARLDPVAGASRRARLRRLAHDLAAFVRAGRAGLGGPEGQLPGVEPSAVTTVPRSRPSDPRPASRARSSRGGGAADRE